MVNENMVFKLAPQGANVEITLSSIEWGFITQIDGQKTVGEIAKNLALTLDEAFKVINSLRKKSLIFFDHEVDTHIEYVNTRFLKKVSEKLTNYVGPVAPFLIKDIMAELKLESEKLPKNRVPDFIELLSDEISDEKKKVNFQKEMLRILREL